MMMMMYLYDRVCRYVQRQIAARDGFEFVLDEVLTRNLQKLFAF